MMPHLISHAGRCGKARGFTLVELLVVIAIIALLVAIVLPTITSTLDRGRMNTCRANLRSLGQALVGYTIDHDSMLPHYFSDGKVWDERLLSYVGHQYRVFLCPGDPYASRGNAQDRPRTYAVNGGQRYSNGNYPFGGSGGQAPMMFEGLRSRTGRLILIGERPGDGVDSRGYVAQYPFCSLDQIPGRVHEGGAGAHYLFSDLGVEYREADEMVLSAQSDYWYVR